MHLRNLLSQNMAESIKYWKQLKSDLIVLS